MSGKMNSICESCGGEILYEKDSTGHEVIQTDLSALAALCAMCADKSGGPQDEALEGSEINTDFDDEHNKALRTGGESNHL